MDTLEGVNSAVDSPVDNQVANARVRFGAGFARYTDLGVHRAAVLLQGPAVDERLWAAADRALVGTFRGVPAPVDDQVAHGAEILTAKFALKQVNRAL